MRHNWWKIGEPWRFVCALCAPLARARARSPGLVSFFFPSAQLDRLICRHIREEAKQRQPRREKPVLRAASVVHASHTHTQRSGSCTASASHPLIAATSFLPTVGAHRRQLFFKTTLPITLMFFFFL